MTTYDVIVVGGGAAGMMASHRAAELGRRVLLLERGDRVGKKLLITGKGRCNLTNQCDTETLVRNVTGNGRFLYGAFHRFTSEDTMAYFEAGGLALKTERGNRVFPVSDRSQDVVRVLRQNIENAGVVLKYRRVSSLIIASSRIAGVICEDGREYRAESVIIATGGKSYPLTGSTGDGYGLAKQAGHTIVPLRPSLIPLVTEELWCKKVQGLSLKNVSLTLLDRGKEIYRELGEMLFTHFGVSGPLVLSASAHMKNIEPGRFMIQLDLKPGLDETKLDLRILRDFAGESNRDFGNSLGKLLPRKLIPVIVAQSGIPYETKVHQVSREQRRKLVSIMKGLPLTIKGFRPLEEAIITSGGVDVSEINPKTMESKQVPGLYFAGEVMDVDAYTGGFNLQIAFSTGHTAGSNA